MRRRQLEAGPAEDDVGSDGDPEGGGLGRLAPRLAGGAVGVHHLAARTCRARRCAPSASRRRRRAPSAPDCRGRRASARPGSSRSTGRSRPRRRWPPRPADGRATGHRRRPEGTAAGSSPGPGCRFPISSVAATSSAAGTPSNASLVHDATPSSAANRSADRSASSRVCTCTPPLCTMARRKRPLAAGVPSSVATLNPPADSPKIVTLPGSPPKTAMLSRTQRKAASWSCRPQFPTSASGSARSR